MVEHGVTMLRLPPEHRRRREGFALTDPGTDLTGALDQANYCIWCHNQGKDSCSHGLKDRKTGAFQKSVVRRDARGLPARRENLRDEPGEGARQQRSARSPSSRSTIRWSPRTGHRICNDCMKACIYQKQEPVDIPQVETRTLKDVLALPWGFEIYGLLTRWNPLDLRRPLPKPATRLQGAGGRARPRRLHARASPDE